MHSLQAKYIKVNAKTLIDGKGSASQAGGVDGLNGVAQTELKSLNFSANIA